MKIPKTERAEAGSDRNGSKAKPLNYLAGNQSYFALNSAIKPAQKQIYSKCHRAAVSRSEAELCSPLKKTNETIALSLTGQTTSRRKTNRELLESSRLSRFRSSTKREVPSSEIPASAQLSAPEQSKLVPADVCRVCKTETLEADNYIQQRIKVCRKCIEHFAQVELAINNAGDEKAQAAKLARIAGRLKFDE